MYISFFAWDPYDSMVKAMDRFLNNAFEWINKNST